MQHSNTDGLNRLGRYLLERGDRAKAVRDFTRARRYYERALSLLPGDPAAQCRVAALEAEGGNIDAAIHMYRSVVNTCLSDEWRANASIALANLYLNLGELSTAETLYQSAVSIMSFERPSENTTWILAHAHCGLGAVEGRKGNPTAAAEQYSIALKYAPEHVPSIANMASAYADLGKHDAAIHALLTALKLERGSSDLWIDLGQLYEEVGSTHLARSAYEIAMQLGAESAEELIDELPPDTPSQWYESGKESELASDPATAAKYYSKASELGDERAKRALIRLGLCSK